LLDSQFLFQEIIPALNQGLVVSLLLILPSAVLGLFLGISAASLRVYGPSWVRWLAAAYIGAFRGTPLVVQLFVLYFGLPNLGVYLTPYTAAVLGFSLCGGAYHAEYIRGGLQSIKKGQLQAAQALGFAHWKAILHIILPQAMRRALPGCGNELIYLIKYSSLAYIITCIELTGQAKNLASSSFRFTEVFIVAGVYYLVLVTLATLGLQKLERQLQVPGFGRAG
jgi:polar amino acid transport system permease protein